MPRVLGPKPLYENCSSSDNYFRIEICNGEWLVQDLLYSKTLLLQIE